MKVNNYVEMRDCFIPATRARYSRCIGERNYKKMVSGQYPILLKCWECPWIRKEKDTGRYMDEKELKRRKAEYERKIKRREKKIRDNEERMERESHYGEYI